MTLNAVLVAIDGSDASLEAARAGLALLAADAPVVIAVVIEPSDPTLVTGAGMAGGVMSVDELQLVDDARDADARADLDAARSALHGNVVDAVIATGEPGPALCDLARDRNADTIVMGSRGRGGIKRALLGSVSDHVVRNAPCPVIITGPAD
jgi:nucleotide-binding universal stress UspA family protein